MQQQMPFTPAHAQHLPAGWSFPTATAPAAAPAGASPTPLDRRPVVGGGAAAASATRVRWGRLLPVLAGAALLAFGAWTVTGPTPAATGAAGSGTSSEPSTGSAGDRMAGRPAPLVEAPKTGPAAARTPGATRSRASGSARPGSAARSTRARAARTRDRAAAARRARARSVRAAAVAATISAPAAAAPPAATAAGGGGPVAEGQLPVTGLESWVAGGIGLLLLALGVLVHVNAVRVAATALLYRRGILLRPVDCARLTRDHGLARARVALSNALHALLSEPAPGDFVGARLAR